MPQSLRRKKRIGVSRTGLRCSSKRNLNPTIQPNRPSDPGANVPCRVHPATLQWGVGHWRGQGIEMFKTTQFFSLNLK